MFILDYKESQKIVDPASHKVIGLQSGSNKGASQSGMTPYGAQRQIIPDALAKQKRRVYGSSYSNSVNDVTPQLPISRHEENDSL
ncbi:hypothetical protein Avbf_17758 [Armadillidium vulgare]|nr:hypothetical protein Avbf_17758 [Armadillidium vulgare]